MTIDGTAIADMDTCGVGKSTADAATVDVHTTADEATASVNPAASVDTVGMVTVDVNDTTTAADCIDTVMAETAKEPVKINSTPDKANESPSMSGGTPEVVYGMDVLPDDVAASASVEDSVASADISAAGDTALAVGSTVDDADATTDITSMTLRRAFGGNSRELFACLKQLFDTEKYCDFTIKTDQGAVHCHKLILSASSSYFQNLFDRINDDSHSYVKSIISKVALDKLLAWLYYCDITIDETCVEELLIVGDKWKFKELMHNCGEYMNKNMNIKNACLFFRLSRQNGINKVAEKCSYFIREHYEYLHSAKLLEKLELQQFADILLHDEINVTNENVIYNSLFSLLRALNYNELCYILCYSCTKSKNITPTFLINKILKDINDVRQKRLDVELKNINEKRQKRLDVKLKNINDRRQKRLDVELKNEVGIRPRFWDSLLYINKNHNLCKYDTISCKWVKYRALVNGRVDPYAAVTTSCNRMVIVGGESSRDINLTEDACPVIKMPELPTQMPNCGVFMADDYIFIAGGQIDINSAPCLNSVYKVWIYQRNVKPLKPMHHGMASPLVVIYEDMLYVIGGINSEDKSFNRLVQALDLTDKDNEKDLADWKVCAKLPQGCDNTNSGFVIYKDKLSVLTTEYCMTYDDVADKWSVVQYECQGDQLKPLIYKNNIWALVKKDGKHCVKCYCKEYNEWKVKIGDVPDVLYTASAMVERSHACNTFHQMP